MLIHSGDTQYRELAAFKSLKVSSQFTNQCTEFQMCASAHTTQFLVCGLDIGQIILLTGSRSARSIISRHIYRIRRHGYHLKETGI